jgi:hypothetical protein
MILYYKIWEYIELGLLRMLDWVLRTGPERALKEGSEMELTRDDTWPVTVTLADAEQYDDGFPPSSAMEFMAWLKGHLDSIPEEFRASAELEIDSNSGYEDSHYAHVVLSYQRPATAEEIAARVDKRARRAAEALAQEKAAYEALKQKYG